MKNKLVYHITVSIQEVNRYGQRLPHTSWQQQSEVNESLPFEEQVSRSKEYIELMMNMLKERHEKN